MRLKKKNRQNICLGINFGKSKITGLSEAKEDYLTSLKLLIPFCDYAAINVSSPNTEGLRKLQDPVRLRELLREIKTLPNCPPLFVKIAPDLSFKDIEDICKLIKEEKIDESIESALQVLRKRVDPDGLLSPVIQRIGNSARILFELPGARDVERIKKLLQGTAQLEFWDAFKGEEFINFIVQANEIVKNIEDSSDESLVDSSEDNQETSEIEELLGSETQVDSVVNPILDLVRGQGYPGGPVIASFDSRGKEKISKYLSMPEVRALLSTEQRFVKFSWGITEVDDEGNENKRLN